MSSDRALVMSLSKTPVEHEDFPEGASRSVDGSIRLLPHFPVECTLDELKALLNAGLPLQVLMKPEPPAPAKKPKAKAKAETKKTPSPSKKSSPKTGK